jgi:hypothetical protein
MATGSGRTLRARELHRIAAIHVNGGGFPAADFERRGAAVRDVGGCIAVSFSMTRPSKRVVMRLSGATVCATTIRAHMERRQDLGELRSERVGS